MHRFLSSFTLLGAAAATQSPALWPFGVEHSTFVDAAPASFTDATSGLLTGAGYPDVAILRNGIPVVFDSPAVRNAVAPIAGAPSGCTALACRRFGVANGHRYDALVVSNATGLHHWKRVSGQMTWATVPGSSNWASLRRLHATDLNGDGTEDLIGVSADGLTLRVAMASGAGYGAQYSVTVGTPITSVTDGPLTDAIGSPRHIFVVQGDSVVAFTSTLASSTPAVSVGSDGILMTLRKPTEHVACLAKSGSTWSLHILNATPFSFTLGALDLVAVSAGDIDEDGDDDLLCSQRNNHRALVLVNRIGQQTSWFSSSAADAMEIPLIGTNQNAGASVAPAPNNQAVPVLVDLDYDGAADMVHPVSSVGDVVLHRSPLGLNEPIPVIGAEFVFGTFSKFSVSVAGNALPDGATALEVVTWPLIFTTQGYVVTGGAGAQTLARIDTSTTISVNVDVDVEHLNNGHAYFAQLRPITRDAAGNLTRVFPPTTLILLDEVELPSNVTAVATFVLPQKPDGGINSGNVITVSPPPPPPPPPGSGTGPL